MAETKSQLLPIRFEIKTSTIDYMQLSLKWPTKYTCNGFIKLHKVSHGNWLSDQS